MKYADIPTKIDTPFAQSAGADYRATIADAPNPGFPGNASWQAGFPPPTFEEIGAGGIPPRGQDMNGVLYSSTVWLKWLNAGAPVKYDGAFAADIAGYPSGAVVLETGGLGWWSSLVDDNVTDPDAGGANWLFVPVDKVYAGNPNGHVAGYAPASNILAALRPASLCWDNVNFVFWRCLTSGNAAAATWAALTNLTPMGAVLTTAAVTYGPLDNGCVRVRQRATAMNDTLPPAGTVDGWNLRIANSSLSTANLTLNVQSGTSLNGVAGPTTLVLAPGQVVGIVADASGNYWKFMVPYTPQAAAGSEGELQYNLAGLLGTTPNMRWDAVTVRLLLAALGVTGLITANNYQGSWYGNSGPVYNASGSTTYFAFGGLGLVIGQAAFTPGQQATLALPITLGGGVAGAFYSYISNTDGYTQNGPSWITGNATSVTFKNNTSGTVIIAFLAIGHT